MSLQKELLKKLATNANDWEWDEYRAIHKKSKISFWICNGWGGFNQYQSCSQREIPIVNWSYLNLWRLFRFLKKGKEQKLLQILNETN